MRGTGKRLIADQIVDIALSYGRTAGATDLGKKHGVTKQRIEQVVTMLRRRYGMDIPRYRNHQAPSPLDEAVRKLRKQSPGMFLKSQL